MVRRELEGVRRSAGRSTSAVPAAPAEAVDPSSPPAERIVAFLARPRDGPPSIVTLDVDRRRRGWRRRRLRLDQCPAIAVLLHGSAGGSSSATSHHVDRSPPPTPPELATAADHRRLASPPGVRDEARSRRTENSVAGPATALLDPDGDGRTRSANGSSARMLAETSSSTTPPLDLGDRLRTPGLQLGSGFCETKERRSLRPARRFCSREIQRLSTTAAPAQPTSNRRARPLGVRHSPTTARPRPCGQEETREAEEPALADAACRPAGGGPAPD